MIPPSSSADLRVPVPVPARVLVCDLQGLVPEGAGQRLVVDVVAQGRATGDGSADGSAELGAAGGVGAALGAFLAAGGSRGDLREDSRHAPGASRRMSARPGPTPAPSFAISVGDAVRRGVPTAARASVLARVPSTGRLADGQVGGELGARLATVCDTLLILGALPEDPAACAPGAEPTAAVLVVDPTGTWWVERLTGLGGRAPSAKRARLFERFGRCAGLCIGPSGEAGAPLANLASLAEPASYVGRGGLGLAFAATGLVALVVLAPPIAPARDTRAEQLRRALERSPRLVARAEGGTLELAEDLAARGARNPEAARNAEAARDAARLAREAQTGRHGCRGCPTPCGWVLDGGSGTVRGARFGALAHLAGLARTQPGLDPRALLARCDDLGLDAKGATLAALRLAPLAADAAVDLLARGGGRAEQLAALFDTRAPDQRDDGVARLARRVAGFGRDPMRVGLALADADPERVARALAPVPWPPPGSSADLLAAGAGRFVWWHECFAAAIDAHGFCAFSAAGLLADGLLSLDELAEALMAPGHLAEVGGGRGVELIALGARLVAARHALAPPSARLARAADAALDPLEADGALPEYRAAVGLDERGVLAPAAHTPPGGARAWLAAAIERLEQRDAAARTPAPTVRAGSCVAPAASEHEAQRGPTGSVTLAAGPSLAARLGGELHVALAGPGTVRAVLAEAERLRPACQGWLLRGLELLPAVHRAGARLGADDVLQPGDRLDLVLVIAGG
jgi:aldehyde:ferredoxin oxidoreductase